MRKVLLTLVISTQLYSFSFAQNDTGSTASSSAIQAYLEQQRQSSSPYASMARMQVDVQYGDFLDALSGSTARREEVENLLVEVIAERAELSSSAMNGQATPAQLAEVSQYEYLRSRLETVLNSAELQLLDSRQDGMAEEQLRNNYLQQLNRIAPDVTDENKQLVLEVLVKHMLFGDSSTGERNRVTAEELIQQQLLSLLDARVEIQDLLSGEQLEMVNVYLNELRSNLFLNQSMDRESSR